MPAVLLRGRAAGVACLLTLLLLASSLSGCVAAIVPVVAGGALIQGQGQGRREAETPVTGVRIPILLAQAPMPPAAPTPAPSPDLQPSPTAPPADALAAAPWQPLVDYALERASRLGGIDPVESALLVGDVLAAPDRLPCTAETPAVLIDLDQGQAPFAPAPGASPVPGLTESLARLRETGVVVLWISQADANGVTEIGDLLLASGLDPAGRDPLLLARSADDRKQVMRKQANVSVCVLAIAGDRRGDFDELFDYLRDPASAAGLDEMLGAGWFLTPGPFLAGSAE